MWFRSELRQFLFYVLRSAFYVLAVLPPEGVTVDAAGVSWRQPQAGVVCVHVYAADWAGDARSSCAVAAAGPARRAVAIGVGEHVYVEARSPWGGEVGPYSIGVVARAWLPIVRR